MLEKNRRLAKLSSIEAALRASNPDLPTPGIYAQSHCGPIGRPAFIVVFGVDDDRKRRRQIRTEASDVLCGLGYVVEIECRRDDHDLKPLRPDFAHDRLRMLSNLRSIRDRTD